MSNGAPVCNLPNRGQVPAIQAGRLRPSVPKVNSLPTAIQAINQLTQIIISLVSPGLPQFGNNLATFDTARPLNGTNGITAAQRGGGGFAMDGEDGRKGEAPYWVPYDMQTERKKVVHPDDEDQYVVVTRIRSVTFKDQTSDNDATITIRVS